MGEHKLPKPQSSPVKRPGAAIFGARSAVAGWKATSAGMDPDTDDFMRALEAILGWVDELEAATDPFAAVVPHLNPGLPDGGRLSLTVTDAVEVPSVPLPHLTVGAFRRLNPVAVREVAKVPLNS